jgi:hypothetical protein
VATNVDLAVGGEEVMAAIADLTTMEGGRDREGCGVVGRQWPQGSERRRGGSEAGWRRTWMEKYMHDQRRGMDLSGTT